ncbi:MAG: hypothetical protein ACKOSQ_08950 [Planctomycetaceae bacterium]
MAVRNTPATVVVCAPWARAAGLPRRHAMPVTWVVDAAGLSDAVRDGAGANLALALDPTWLASRQILRTALVRARHAAPGIAAAVLRSAALDHHAVLAEEGFRVVVVDAFAALGRGSRRPAPAGWPCRNVAWGLWEVLACPPRRPRGWAWLPGLPAPHRGGLHVAVADGGAAGRLLDWAGQGVARGRAAAVALAELPAILEGRRPSTLSASVLNAA